MYKIKQKIKIKNKTKFAKNVGIPISTLSRIINGKQNCSKVMAFCIAKHLNSTFEIEDIFDVVK